MYNTLEFQSTNITGALTTNVFLGKGRLGSVIVNAVNAGGTITISDQASPAVTKATITLYPSAAVTYMYNMSIGGGLRIVTSASPDITVTWTQT